MKVEIIVYTSVLICSANATLDVIDHWWVITLTTKPYKTTSRKTERLVPLNMYVTAV